MKKRIFYALLVLTLFCVIAQAARPKRQNTLKEENYTFQQNYSQKTVKSSELTKAQNYYISGKLDKAELLLNEILLLYPDNTEALELKNKILIVKEKFFVFKRDSAEEYMIESERSFRDGNFYEGLLYYKRAVDLMPEIYDSQRYNTIIGELNAQSLKYKSSDRKKFIQSVESFQNGDFKKAKALVDSLSYKYEHMKSYRGLMDFFQIEYTNTDRVNEYYKEAMEDFKKGRFESARILLDFAKSINNKNPDIALLSEQIDLEIN